MSLDSTGCQPDVSKVSVERGQKLSSCLRDDRPAEVLDHCAAGRPGRCTWFRWPAVLSFAAAAMFTLPLAAQDKPTGNTASTAVAAEAPAATTSAPPPSAPPEPKASGAKQAPTDASSSAAASSEAQSKAEAAARQRRLAQARIVLLVGLLYLAAMVFVRWHLVARPARELLAAEIAAMRTRTELLPASPARDQVEKLLGLAEQRLTTQLLDYVLWTRGQEHAGWHLVHEAKEQWAVQLPPEPMRTALRDAESELRATSHPNALQLADDIKSALAESPMDSGDPQSAGLRSVSALISRAVTDTDADAAKLAKSPDTKAQAWAAWANLSLLALNGHGELLARACSTSTPVPSDPQAAAEATARAASGYEGATLLVEAHHVLAPAFVDRQQRLRDAVQATPALTAEAWRELAVALRRTGECLVSPLASRIQLALQAAPLAASPRRRALIEEAQNQVYEERDNSFAEIASWHKKTLWLVALSLMLMALLAAGAGRAELFLLGALGGLLSRLARASTATQTPTDYGASWTTLFLSPVVGGLSGWACVMLVAWAHDQNLLGSAFANISWREEPQLAALGAALLFGALERGFVSIVTQIETKAGLVDAKATAATAPAAAKAKQAAATAEAAAKATATEVVVEAAAAEAAAKPPKQASTHTPAGEAAKPKKPGP